MDVPPTAPSVGEPRSRGLGATPGMASNGHKERALPRGADERDHGPAPGRVSAGLASTGRQRALLSRADDRGDCSTMRAKEDRTERRCSRN